MDTDSILITGNLHAKNGKWHMVLYGKSSIVYPGRYTPTPDKMARRWISTNLAATKKNYFEANKMLYDKIEELKKAAADLQRASRGDYAVPNDNELLFTEFIFFWLSHRKGTIQQSTWEKYETIAESHLIPYFSELGLTLKQVKPKHILEYYNYKNTGGRHDGKEGGLGNASLRSHAALLKAILNEAVVLEYIQGNPALNVSIPKRATTTLIKDKNVYMTASEANKMLGDIQTEEIYPLVYVYVALYYGLRKSEVLGLKWDAVDFDKDTMEIKSTVVKNKTIVYKDTTKTEGSHQVYELLPEVKSLLLDIKAKQETNINLYGAIYTPSDYIFTHPDGRLYRPDCVTRSFQRALKRHNLPTMRFHDLRHSTASILFDKGWDLESVKSWLRHTDIETTSNIYLHISKTRKRLMAKDMSGTFIAPYLANESPLETGEEKSAD